MKSKKQRAIYLRMLLFVFTAVIMASSTAISYGQAGGLIFFVLDNGSNRNIYSIRPDGSDQRNLTGNENENVQPSLSPDQTQIAFSSNRDGNFELYLMSVNGSNQRRLSPGDGKYSEEPSWSPDGQRIVFVSKENRSSRIATIKPDGTGLTFLTEPGEYFEPAWSPDGRSIVYVTYGKLSSEIHLMNNDGSNSRPFITGDEEEMAAPAWSPDGKRIAYAARIGLTSEIYIRDIDTSADSLLISIEDNMVSGLSWSEDGTEIVYSTSAIRSSDQQVRVIGVDGQNAKTVTPQTLKAYDSTWVTPRATAQVSYGTNTTIRSEVLCEGTLPSRLTVGEQGRVTTGGGSNRVRRSPSTSASQVGSLAPDKRFRVIGGPECADGYTWWEIERQGEVSGWTAEGAPNEYWLEPFVRPDFVVEAPAGARLLSGGRGLTTGAVMNNGNFQVEGYCANQGYRTTRDNTNWYCQNRNGTRAFTFMQAEYDQVCQQTYNDSSAIAVRDGDGRILAFRWRCYSSNGGGSASSPTSPTTGNNGSSTSSTSSSNPDFIANGQTCAGRTPQHRAGDSVAVDFNRGGSLRILVDYRSTSLRTTAQAYDNDRLELKDGPVCWGGLIYWYVELNGNSGHRGWAAEADNTNNPFMCSLNNPECRI